MTRVIRFMTSLTGFVCCSWAVAEESSLAPGRTAVQESYRAVVTLSSPVDMGSFSAGNKACTACDENKGRVGRFVDRLWNSRGIGRKNEGQRKSFYQNGVFKRVFHYDDQRNKEQPEKLQCVSCKRPGFWQRSWNPFNRDRQTVVVNSQAKESWFNRVKQWFRQEDPQRSSSVSDGQWTEQKQTRVNVLIHTLQSGAPSTERVNAVEELGTYNNRYFPEVTVALVNVSNDPHDLVRLEAVKALGQLDDVDASVLGALEIAARDPDRRVRHKAVRTLASMALNPKDQKPGIEGPSNLEK